MEQAVQVTSRMDMRIERLEIQVLRRQLRSARLQDAAALVTIIGVPVTILLSLLAVIYR